MKSIFSVAAVLSAFISSNAKLVNLDPEAAISGNVTAKAEIIGIFEDCKFDAVIDVRGQYISDSLHIEEALDGVGTFEATYDTQVQTGDVKSVVIYCWTKPFQSTSGAHQLNDKYEDLTIYDVKGLQYLKEIPEMCPFLRTPQCTSENPDERRECRRKYLPKCADIEAREDSCKVRKEKAIQEAAELLKKVAEQKALEEARKKEEQVVKSRIEQCQAAVCQEDLCADGKARRMIDDDCCACPNEETDKSDHYLKHKKKKGCKKNKNQESTFAVGQPGFYGVIAGSVGLLVLIAVVIVVVMRNKRRLELHRVNVKVTTSKELDGQGDEEDVVVTKQKIVNL